MLVTSGTTVFGGIVSRPGSIRSCPNSASGADIGCENDGATLTESGTSSPPSPRPLRSTRVTMVAWKAGRGWVSFNTAVKTTFTGMISPGVRPGRGSCG